MEEELNEHDLEERLYAMLHHVDETQNDLNDTGENRDARELVENGPKSTLRRYWRSDNPHQKVNTPANSHQKVNTTANPYQKVNTPANPYQKVNTPANPNQKANTLMESANLYQNVNKEPAHPYQKLNTCDSAPPAVSIQPASCAKPKLANNTIPKPGNVTPKPNNSATTKPNNSATPKPVHAAIPKLVYNPVSRHANTLAPKLSDDLTYNDTNSQPKEERSPEKPPSPVDLTVFLSPVPQNVKKTIQILDHDDDNQVLLESSDEDEVVEVALPPKPTIMIESSDEDELEIIKPHTPLKETKSSVEKSKSGERGLSTSPVPSVVSSVSDEFIRGDCIALNISSRRPDKHSFDFSLHGSDLAIQNTNTSSKKKKKKKNKAAVTSTPIAAPAEQVANTEVCFATPKSKAKNKKQKTKLFTTEKSIPTPDVYDSDSNQSLDITKNKNPYIVSEKSLPSADVYESDSNQSETLKEINTDQSKKQDLTSCSDRSISNDKQTETTKSTKNDTQVTADSTVDLTDETYIPLANISESIVIGNVTGFTKFTERDESRAPCNNDISKYVSSKIPSILNEDLDFDHLKGKDKVCKKRRYSLSTIREEMDKFYNESWGGEDFNHREIQKNMSRDKSLWAIDPKDRMPSLAQRRTRCQYCNRLGHRDDACRQRPAVCYMCGEEGHCEPRCPSKICVNCGSPNMMYSTACRNCASWGRLQCAECGQPGHPASHCPDLWRRYHNTIDVDTPLEVCQQTKKHYQMFCSGCARRGHLVHACRATLPFSGLPINSPYVCRYRPVYRAAGPGAARGEPSPATPPQNNKRHSKSPVVHETHLNKKRNVSDTELRQHDKSLSNVQNTPEVDSARKNKKELNKSLDPSNAIPTPETAPDFIPINSTNHDNKGHVIQDNEVSDTSDVVTSSRLYVTKAIIDQLKTKEGNDWLNLTTEKLNVAYEYSDVDLYFTIRGNVANQDKFHSELRKWSQLTEKDKMQSNNEVSNSTVSGEVEAAHNIPKNRISLLRYLGKALDSLKEDLGDPKHLHNELTYFQKRHKNLLIRKVISPTVLFNNRTLINDMLKKLNTVLIGQAGLADGQAHVSELYALQKQLMSSHYKTVPQPVLEEIGQHFHSIFSPIMRNDYTQLLSKYYSKHLQSKKNRKRKSNKERKLAKLNKSIPSQCNSHSEAVDTDNSITNTAQPNHNGNIVKTNNSNTKAAQPNNNSDVVKTSNSNTNAVKINKSTNDEVETNIGNTSTPKHNRYTATVKVNKESDASIKAMHLKKLLYYHRMLTNIRPQGNFPRKERTRMLRQIHQSMTSINKSDKINSKVAKKMRKAQNEAHNFLACVN